jgi:hypothetical protein
MNGEKVPITTTVSSTENGFYTGQEVSTGSVGTTGISRRVLHGLTIISVFVASICTIYGSVQAASAAFLLPFFIVLTWLVIHFVLLYFAQNDQHDFHPPAWFLFISSGHIFMQSLVVIILTVFKAET